MTRKNLYSVIKGLFISGVVSGVVYFILFYDTIDMFGVERVINPEARHSKIFYTALITTISIIICSAIILKLKRKYLALGIFLPSIVGFWILTSVGIVYLDKSNYYEPFDKSVWHEPGSKPIKMVRWLIKNESLIDLQREDVLDKLGAENGHEIGFKSESNLHYSTFGGYAVFTIQFEGNNVKSTTIFYD